MPKRQARLEISQESERTVVVESIGIIDGGNSEEDKSSADGQSKSNAGPAAIDWIVHANSVLFGSYMHSGLSTLPAHTPSENHTKVKVSLGGFDLDDTLISTKSGLPFAKSEADWKFRFGHAKTLSTLTAWASQDTTEKILVIFSNQGGISLTSVAKRPKKTRIDERRTRLWQFKTKLISITNLLGLPLYVVAAVSKDRFRKPQTGMWDLVKAAHERHLQLQSKSDQKIEIELAKESSFFVGDAAGRKGDHSTVDLEFAKSLGVKFYTPEHYFK